jgi:SagB-type dehydrogenase family enzyme
MHPIKNSVLKVIALTLIAPSLAFGGCHPQEPLQTLKPPPVNTPTPVPPPEPTPAPTPEAAITLPEPQHDSEVSLEQSLLERRSIRSYSEEPVTIQELSQLLWAAQGVTDERGFRTAPSAGALYPLELYVVAGNVQDLAPAVYRYGPEEHSLAWVLDGDRRSQLAEAALSQSFVEAGALAVVITAVYERTTLKYGERGVRYVHIEAGHATQNLLLQATVMELGAVPVGAFNDDSVARLLDLPDDEQPLYIIPVGRK